MPANLKEKLADEFKAFESRLNGLSGSEIHSRRKDAFANFDKLGFPTRKHEEWRFTNTSFLYKNDFKVVTEPEKATITKDDLDIFKFEDLDDNVIIIYNGFYSKELSNIVSESKGLVITSLADAFKNHKGLAEEYFARNTKDDSDAFNALNTAFASDGAFIYIPDNVEVNHNIHLIFLTEAKDSDIIVQPRNLVIAGKNSRAKIVQTCYTFGKQAGFTNLVTEINVAKDAVLDFYKIHNCKGNSYYMGSTEATQEEKSVFTNVSVSLNGKFQRNVVNTKQLGEHCETNYFGLYIMNGEDFIDNRTLVDHTKPNCTSNENYRGIIDDKAHAVFNGKIIVRQDAQKTEAFQSNKNILLTNDAQINTKPQLEIFADDVKCSHGATSGNLNKDEIFYLNSRGIDNIKAKALLLNAFSSEVLEKINVTELRNGIKKLVAERLTVDDDIYFCEILENKKVNF